MKSKESNLPLLPTVKKLLLLVVVVLLFSCERDDKFTHPVVHTGEVREITGEGARFSGRIVNEGGVDIVDHGFVWDTKTNPVIGESYFQSLGMFTTSDFSVFAVSAWEEGNTYFMRAFANTGQNIYYGREVSFVSLGGAAPFITGISPNHGTWGDTIEIKGKHFSSKPGENIILIHNIRPETILDVDTLIKVLIPEKLDTINATISLSIRGNITYSPENFRLLPPEINDFTPSAGPINDTVVIYGKHFRADNTIVKFGDKKAEIIEQNYDSLAVLVPGDLPEGELPISVDVLGQITIAEDVFFYEKPVIIALVPETVTWGDSITIYGRYFGDTPDYTTVRVDNKPAEILHHTKDSILVKIPYDVKVKKPIVEVIVRGIKATAHNQITIIDMVINSFYPHSGTFLEVIEITGENFNPEQEYIDAFIGDNPLTILSVSNNLLRARIPGNNSVAQGRIKIKSGNLEAQSSEEFTMVPHTIDHFSPDEGSRLNQVTVYGQGFSPDIHTNKIYMGDKRAEVLSVSTTQITFEIPTGLDHGMQSIRVEVIGNNLEFAEQFMLYEPFRRLNDPVFGARTGAFSFVIDQTGFVGGGIKWPSGLNRDLYSYDTDSDTWEQMPNCPTNVSTGLSFSTSTKGYVFNINSYNRYILHAYDYNTGIWSTLTNLPYFREITHSPFVINDTVYITNKPYNSIPVLWAYIESSDHWVNKGTLPFNALGDGSGFSIGNKGYLALGNTSNGFNRIWEYNPSDNSWTGMIFFNTVMPGGTSIRAQSTAIVLDNNAFIFGGSRPPSFDVDYSDAYRFDPESNTLVRIPDIPGKRRRAWAFSLNGKVYFGGGEYTDENGDHHYLEDFYEFDPAKLPPPGL